MPDLDPLKYPLMMGFVAVCALPVAAIAGLTALLLGGPAGAVAFGVMAASVPVGLVAAVFVD